MEDYPISSIEPEQFINRIAELRPDDITEFDELARVAGYQRGFAKKTVEKAAAYSVGLVDLYIDGDTTSGNVTLTLPASPIDGETHIMTKKVAANTLSFDGNGNNINGSGTLSITTQYAMKTVVFFPSAGEWRGYG